MSRGFVKHQNFGALEQSPCEANQLPFPNREICPTVWNLEVKDADCSGIQKHTWGEKTTRTSVSSPESVQPSLSLSTSRTWVRAFQISSSVYLSTGSKFRLIVPLKRMESCGIIAKRERRSWSPSFSVSIWSMRMLPEDGSTIRKRVDMKVDFPAPVRPTIPT